jgi:hypothetical protein
MKPLLLTVVMLLLGINVFAQDYVNKEFHFAISLPPNLGWSPAETRTAAGGMLVFPQLLVLMAPNRSGDRISVQIFGVGDGVSLDEQEYREGLRSGSLKSLPPTMQLASENRGTFAGVPSYEMIIGGTMQNQPMNIRIVSIVANQHQYNVTGYSGDAARLTTGEIAAALSSFRFTEPPTLATPRLTPRRLGEILGQLMVYAATVIVIGLVIRLLFKRRKTA